MSINLAACEWTSSVGPSRARMFRAAVSCFLVCIFVLPVPAARAQEPARTFDADAIDLPDGYEAEVVIANLSVPTTLLFDGDDLLVAESGWVNTALPRVLRIAPDGVTTELAGAGLESPVTGLAMVDGQLYVSHRGKVSIAADGVLRDVVTGLPSGGDHQNNNLVLGADGNLYLGQGTVTNSGVVGMDSYIFGWLEKDPEAHDVPCEDITLVGLNFETDNPLTEDPDDKAVTGAYKPFGTPSTAGETIPGDVKCGGSILRFAPDGSDLEVFAWGLRNPFGLESDRQGRLWATFHGADVRGSRNIFNDPDYLVGIEEGAWYGWPEFFDGEPVTAARFDSPTKDAPALLWQDHPPLAEAFTTFDSHAAANGLAFSPGGAFGFDGDAFVAMFGSFLPATTGINIELSGFSVQRVDMTTGTVEEFANNSIPGPDYLNQAGGFDRPSDVAFGPDGGLYVVDWGASTVGVEGLKLVPRTGAVWRIYNSETQVPRQPGGPITVKAPPEVPDDERQPMIRNVPELYKMIAGPIGLLLAGVVVVVLLIVVVWRAARRR